MSHEKQDIGIVDFNGTLFYHHDWIKKYVRQVQHLQETMQEIAYNKNLTAEESQKMAYGCLEKLYESEK